MWHGRQQDRGSSGRARAVSKPAPLKARPQRRWQAQGSSCGAARPTKAVENFPISGETVPVPVVHWLARIKGAAAAVNAELGLLRTQTAARIERAAAEIAAGEHDAQFPIDVFQTGSGTSTNMNANEVIATSPASGVHPNDHVNMGQSSNDVFPSAVHLAALERGPERAAAGARGARALAGAQGPQLQGRRQGGPHAPDGRGAGDARAGVRRLRRPDRPRARSAIAAALVHVGQIPLGGTATGTGLNTHPKFAARVAPRLRRESGLRQIDAPRTRSRPGQPRRPRRAVGRAEGARRVADEDRRRPRADGLRTAGRASARSCCPSCRRAPRSCREGQPGDPRGRPAGLRAGDRQRHRDHRRREPGPVRAQRPDPADRAQPAAARSAC